VRGTFSLKNINTFETLNFLKYYGVGLIYFFIKSAVKLFIFWANITGAYESAVRFVNCELINLRNIGT